MVVVLMAASDRVALGPLVGSIDQGTSSSRFLVSTTRGSRGEGAGAGRGRCAGCPPPHTHPHSLPAPLGKGSAALTGCRPRRRTRRGGSAEGPPACCMQEDGAPSGRPRRDTVCKNPTGRAPARCGGLSGRLLQFRARCQRVPAFRWLGSPTLRKVGLAEQRGRTGLFKDGAVNDSSLG